MCRFALLLLSLSLVACGEPMLPESDAKPAKVVDVAVVQELALSRTYSLTGTTRAVDHATLAPQVSGVLKKRLVNLGDRVERGELLAQLDTPELAPAHEASVARLAELKLKHTQAERDFERVKELFGKGVVTKREMEQSKTQRDAISAAVTSAEAEELRTRRLVAETQLRAPISGEVVRVEFEPGEFVAAGQGVMAIAGDAVEVEFGVPETLLTGLSVGQPVTLALPLFKGRPVDGRIVELANKVALPARLFPLIVSLEPGEGILPGLTVMWTLQILDTPRLMVPLQAVASPAGAAPRVYRLVGNRVEKVTVVPGEVNGEKVAIEGAINAGEEVVVAGLNSLVDGQVVEAQR